MRRLFYGLLMLIMATAMAIPVAPALAESEDAPEPLQSLQPALAIKAPGIAEVGQPVTIAVFGKHNRETIAGASVYALRTGELVITADKANYTTLVNGFEALAEARGIVLGTTGADGTLTGKFPEKGRFVLVATRDGYIPGFARITVSAAASRALNIKAPGATQVNKSITISVTGRYSRQPVSGVAIYSQMINTSVLPLVSSTRTGEVTGATANSTAAGKTIVPPKAMGSSLRMADATVIKADPANVTVSAQLASEMVQDGTLLGNTDANGQLTCTFANSGVYLLTAVMDGYAPAFARISVLIASGNRLAVKSPGSANLGDSVTFVIIDRTSGHGTGGATLWALAIDDIKGTADSIWDSLQSGSAASEVVEKYRGWAQDKGMLIGTSSESGEVTFTFKESGRYLLVAVKEGLRPGFGRIKVGAIGPGLPRLSIKTPSSAAIGQMVTIRVYDTRTGQPVEKAAVSAIKPKFIEPPTIQPSPSPTVNGTATQILIDASTDAPVNDKEVEGLLLQSAIQPIALGYTDANGDVQYAFPSEGRYVVTALKDGYMTGGARINIVSTQSSGTLVINTALNLTSGQPALVKVWDKSSGQPVSAAAVYVLKVNRTAVIRPLPTITIDKPQVEPGKPATAIGKLLDASPADGIWIQNQAENARKNGVLVGYTDDGGQLSYSFTSAGQFILATFKDGYNPGFVSITYNLPISSTAATP